MNIDQITLSVLADEAREYAPRLFALYGVYREEFSPTTRTAPRLGHGVRRARHGEARLVWLTDPHPPTADDYDLAGH
ncbi:hypothetical protein [Amycolatopsis aidingensis]|uniref:hypothetical protein n=1 Tax=Amycolatopsis aidingensis TaxID=2842453 RepID=UPI001C0D0D0B|nr:hypothetical protein [Amycolatopsis aidingensis]